MPPSTRYLVVTFASLAALLATLAGFNAVLNPQGVFGVGHPAIFAKYLQLGSRVGKANVVAQGGAEIVLFGSSRVDTGFDPASPAFAGRPAYNAGLFASDLQQEHAALRFALAHNPRLRLAIIGLDLEYFYPKNLAPHELQLDLERSRFNPNLSLPQYYLANLVGAEATARALRTLSAYLHHDPSGWTLSGFKPAPLPGGPAAPAHFRESLALTCPLGWEHPDLRRVDEVAEMVDEVRAAGAEPLIVLLPGHAIIKVLWQLEGAGLEGQTFKRELAKLADRKHVRVVDFDRINAWTTERAFDPMPDGTRHWHDTGHFTRVYGDVLLGRALRGATSTDDLTGANVETRLADDVHQLEAYLRDQPDVVRLVAQTCPSVHVPTSPSAPLAHASEE